MIGQKKALSNAGLRKLPKILLHEHLDCSLRPRTLLELWDQIGFQQSRMGFPRRALELWRAAKVIKFSGEKEPEARKQNLGLAEKLQVEAAALYERFLVKFASKSLANYVQAIVDHVLPTMQTMLNLNRITRERIKDAVDDGVVAMELRFAPQLHTMGGLTLDQVMQAVTAAVDESPIPVKLIICALRHEDGKVASQLADLAIRYKAQVGAFDLAADEKARPGVLSWWIPEAMRVRQAGIDLTIHLWETDEPTEADLELLDRYDLQRLGHGIRGDRQGNRVLEICPTSNVVTGQVACFEEHPIDRLYREGKQVTVNTDGTLFTRVDLTGEYAKLQKHCGWGLADFYAVNLTALNASSFSGSDKCILRARLVQGYSRS